MPLLSTDIGSSNISNVAQPSSSLFYRIVDVTPENNRISTYVPFFEPTWQTGTLGTSRVLATATVPLALWSGPGGDVGKGADADKALSLDRFYGGKYTKEDTWFNKIAVQLMPLESDTLSARTAAGVEGESTYSMTFHATEAQGDMKGEARMYNKIGDYAGANRNEIGVTVNEKGLSFVWTNSLFEDLGRRYNRLIMDQGRWKPYMQAIGLGTLDKKNGNSGVPKRWFAGHSAYLQGAKQTMSGDWHIPMDFMPYSAQRRSAPYHNMWHKAFANFIDRFDQDSTGIAMSNAEKMAMSSLVLGQYAGFGQSGVVPNSPPEPASMADRFLDFVGQPAAGSYLDFDPVSYVFGSARLPTASTALGKINASSPERQIGRAHV